MAFSKDDKGAGGPRLVPQLDTRTLLIMSTRTSSPSPSPSQSSSSSPFVHGGNGPNIASLTGENEKENMRKEREVLEVKDEREQTHQISSDCSKKTYASIMLGQNKEQPLPPPPLPPSPEYRLHKKKKKKKKQNKKETKQHINKNLKGR